MGAGARGGSGQLRGSWRRLRRARRLVLRPAVDRCACAAGQAVGRLCSPGDGGSPPLCLPELDGRAARHADPGTRTGPWGASDPGGGARLAPGRHAADPGRNRLHLRRGADLRSPAGRGDAAGSARPAGRSHRGRPEHGGAPDRLPPLRDPLPRRTGQWRGPGRAHRRDLDGGAGRQPRPGGDAEPRLRELVGLCQPLRPLALLCLRLRLRRPAGRGPDGDEGQGPDGLHAPLSRPVGWRRGAHLCRGAEALRPEPA